MVELEVLKAEIKQILDIDELPENGSSMLITANDVLFNENVSFDEMVRLPIEHFTEKTFPAISTLLENKGAYTVMENAITYVKIDKGGVLVNE